MKVETPRFGKRTTTCGGGYRSNEVVLRCVYWMCPVCGPDMGESGKMEAGEMAEGHKVLIIIITIRW